MKLKLPKTQGKNGKFKLFALGLGFLLLLAALGLTVLTVTNSYDPISNSGSPKTPLEPQSNTNPTPTPTPYSPSPTPLFTPTPSPTPYQWINPTPPVETPTPTPAVSAEVWQTLYVTNSNGGTYWVNPPKPITLALFGSPTGSQSDLTLVSTLQNNIYMKLNTQKPVASWAFSAKETIAVTDLNGNILGTIVNNVAVTENGVAVPNNQNVWVLGSSLSAFQLQPLISHIAGYGQCYFVIKLSDIQLNLTFNDGTGLALSASGGDAQNTLKWLVVTTSI